MKPRYTPPYRIEVVDQSGYKWSTPCDYTGFFSIKYWVDAFDASIQNGVNKHLGTSATIRTAKLIDQKTGRITQSYTREAE